MKIKPKYKKIATKILFSGEPITKEDLESLDMFNTSYLERLSALNDHELKRKLIDIISRETVISFE